MVGGIRHLEPFQCMIGVLSMNLFVGLQSDRSMSFLIAQDGAPPSWQRKRIIHAWGTEKAGYEAARQACKRVTNACGISWGKVTHFRKAGMDEASKEGLDDEIISSMSKHTRQKMNQYVTELNPTVMKCMAGFSQDDDYFIPRADLLLPDWMNEELLVNTLFPDYHMWTLEQQSVLGEKTDAAQNFLYVLLPFLAKVIFQDGVYWVDKFPQHEVSRLLRGRMPPNYERWAVSAREEVLAAQRRRDTSLIQTYNEAAQQAFTHISQVINQLKEELKEKLTQIRN